MLHVAPERCFEERLYRRLGKGYLTADLDDPRAMVRMDVTAIPHADDSFDFIYCSHVLEHVEDDRAAIREFRRTLKASGTAVLLVPITEISTFEDPSIVDPIERHEAFGQADHVRRYGVDFVERLREAGFEVDITRVSDLFDTMDIERMGLTPASGEIFICRKGP